MLDFLWTIPANSASGLSPVTFEHLEWIAELKNWVLTSTNDMQIDNSDLQMSMRLWLENQIDQYKGLNNAKAVRIVFYKK